MGKYSYRKRAFLAPISTGFTSYIFAEVERSNKGQYRGGTYMITLADCRRCIELELEFFLGTALARRQSLAKIDLLLEILSRFQQALKIEAQFIEDCERKPKGHSPKRKDSH